MPATCTFRLLAAKAKPGHYFDEEGTSCGLPMEDVETKGGRKLLCPVHDRYPNYIPRLTA